MFTKSSGDHVALDVSQRGISSIELGTIKWFFAWLFDVSVGFYPVRKELSWSYQLGVNLGSRLVPVLMFFGSSSASSVLHFRLPFSLLRINSKVESQQRLGLETSIVYSTEVRQGRAFYAMLITFVPSNEAKHLIGSHPTCSLQRQPSEAQA